MGLEKPLLRASVVVALLSSVIFFGFIKPVRLPPPVDASYEPPVPISKLNEWHLRLLPWEELVQIFYQLPAPSKPLDGEYTATMLDGGSAFINAIGYLGFSPLWPGTWVGKAFVGGEGWGYNIFRWRRRAHRRIKMEVGMASSVWDQRPIFQLQYKRQKHALGRAMMRDEIREIRPGLYLGMGTMGWTTEKRSEPMPFMLTGPHSPAKPHLFSEGLLHDHLPDGLRGHGK